MTKKIYVAKVHWKEDGKWMKTNLWAFENKIDAENYCLLKQKQSERTGNKDKSRYTIEEITLLDSLIFFPDTY